MSGGSIDFRSDTVTKPTAAMREAMSLSIVGDDVFEEDVTVIELQKRVAKLMNKEDALFFPTGTMTNLAAVMSWCGSRGSEVILGDNCHIFQYEQGGIAQIAGVSPRIIQNNSDGTMDLDKIEEAIRSDNIHFPKTELIALESTHNMCGGRILSLDYIESVAALAQKHNIPLHMDGARIWNAASALDIPLSKMVNSVDSISACLSKGLGAPIGSLLIGPKFLIAKARRIRKALGGGMRQVGVIAAVGLKAIDDFEMGILKDDNMKASYLASELSHMEGFKVDVKTVETNIIIVELNFPNFMENKQLSNLFVKEIKLMGVLVLPRGPFHLRVVTHRDLSWEDVKRSVPIFRDAAAFFLS